jgi:hypothetical protein
MQALRVEPVERIGSLAEALDGHPEAEAASYPLAMVEWHDAWFDLDQLTIDDRRTDYLVRTVGFLIDDGARVVSLAQELLPDGEGFRAVTHIPRPVVQRLVRLGTGA